MTELGPFHLMDISASGLGAERARLAVITRNVANSMVSPSAPGEEPYRRQQVLFETVLNEAQSRESGVPIGGARDVPCLRAGAGHV